MYYIWSYKTLSQCDYSRAIEFSVLRIFVMPPWSISMKRKIQLEWNSQYYLMQRAIFDDSPRVHIHKSYAHCSYAVCYTMDIYFIIRRLLVHTQHVRTFGVPHQCNTKRPNFNAMNLATSTSILNECIREWVAFQIERSRWVNWVWYDCTPKSDIKMKIIIHRAISDRICLSVVHWLPFCHGVESRWPPCSRFRSI